MRNIIRSYFEIMPRIKIGDFEALVENIFGKLKRIKVDLRRCNEAIHKH